jgi:hypothetical protein
MTSEEYRSLAADFRARAQKQECPAFRAELEDLARCYEWAATASADPIGLPSNDAKHLSDGILRRLSIRGLSSPG